MKILKLKFKNINSLVGENEIDFTTPFFTNDGLFVITGKTGAGKSSILDAITLALYGKTPRVEISGTENHVMTKGQKDCYSEVTFEVSGKKWIASWKQERTKTGTLKQVERAIIDDKNNIVADKLTIKRNVANSDEKTVNEKMNEILGLSFSQFTKVILLAQGSFTAFLKADKNDKGELLEQITGTEIYGEISKQVFERARLEEEKLKSINSELGAIQVLSDADLLELEVELNQFTESKKEIENQVAQLESSFQWLKDIENISIQIQQATKNLPSLENKYQEANADFTLKETELTLAKKTFKDQEETFKKVRSIDTKTEEKSKLLNPLITQLAVLEINKTELKQTLTLLETSLSSTKDNLLIKQNWAQTNLKLEELVTTYPVISFKSNQFQTKKEEFNTLNKVYLQQTEELNTLQTNLDKELAAFLEINSKYTSKNNELEALKVALSSILSGKEISKLQEEKELLLKSKDLLKKTKEQVINITKVKDEIEEIKSQLIRLNDSTPILNQQIENRKEENLRLENKITLLEENIQLAKTIQSLEEHRLSLKDDEPCPLCGSTEHPYRQTKTPVLGDREKELKDEKKILSDTSNILLTLLQKQAQEQTEKQNLDLNLTKAEQNLIDKTDELDSIIIELKEVHIELKKTHLNLDDIQLLFEKKNSELTEIVQLLQEANSKENEIANLRDLVLPQLLLNKTVSEQKKLDAESTFNTKKELLEEKKNSVKRAEEQFKIDEKELNQEFQKYAAKDLADLTKKHNNWILNKTQIDDLQADITKSKTQITQHTTQIDNLQESFQQKLDQKNHISNELDLLKQERTSLFGDNSVDTEETKLKTIIARCESNKNDADTLKQQQFNTFNTTKAVLDEKKRELTQKQALNLTTTPLLDLTKEVEESKLNLDKVTQSIGANNQKLATNKEKVETVSSILPKKIEQESILKKWTILNDQIGSKDGKKYRNFAQALTFEHLIALANKQLQKMSDRYALKRTGDANNPFELSVIDSFQNNDERTAQNLCGGENFMVSLSLALGLANMAGKNMQIDSMFIDEGFATLDPDTLDVALNTLSNLQTEGKMIGVISHISELKERIATHVQVVQTGNGYSKIILDDQKITN